MSISKLNLALTLCFSLLLYGCFGDGDRSESSAETVETDTEAVETDTEAVETDTETVETDTETG